MDGETFKMIRKKILLIMTAVFCILAVAGCKQNVGTPEDNAVVEEPEEEPEEDLEGCLFGFSCPDMQDPFYEVLKESVASDLQDQGSRLLVRDAADDASLQMDQIREMIESGVSAVFLCPVDPEKITPALEELKEANIPVINFDIRTADEKLVSSFVGSDDYNAGKVCGEDLCARFPQGGNIAIVECPQISSLSERINGFEETIKDSGFQIVSRIDTKKDDSVIQNGISSILSVPKTEPDAIMCGDDVMALQVLKTLKDTGRTDILVYTVGGSPEIKEELKKTDSPLAGIGALSPINIGRSAVKTAEAVLKDEKYEKEVYEDTFFINRDNIDMYGTDGWQ